MIQLLVLNFRHILRSKLLLMLLVFTFLIQFVFLKLVSSFTLNYEGLVSTIGPKQAIFAALFLQLFTGAFLSAVYGIWMMPYLHSGGRSQLTFVMPISRWYFPAVYAITMFALLLLQHALMLLSYGFLNGFDRFLSPEFPWSAVLRSLVLETVAFEVCMFAFGVSSLVLGQIPTFFLGAMSFLVLQVAAAFFRFDFAKYFGTVPDNLTVAQFVYSWLPPLGELVFDLKEILLRRGAVGYHLMLWAIWLVIFALLFRLKIRYPSQTRGTDS